MIARRTFFRFTAGAVAAPLVIRAGLLMPISTTPTDGVWIKRRGIRDLYVGPGKSFEIFQNLTGVGAFAEQIVPITERSIIEGWYVNKDGHNLIWCEHPVAVEPGELYRMKVELT